MFCPKCGKEIPDQAVFCPKCGASINVSSDQPRPSPTQPAVPSNPSGVLGAAALTQRKAVKALLLILLLNLILAGMWMSGTFVISELDGSNSMPVSLVEYFQGALTKGYIVTCVFALLAPIISGGFLGRHILKKDGKVNIPILPWLYWIWAAGFHTVAFFVWKKIFRENPEYTLEFAFSTLGWLYNLLCVVLAVALVYLTVLHFKASKERKTQPTLQ